MNLYLMLSERMIVYKFFTAKHACKIKTLFFNFRMVISGSGVNSWEVGTNIRVSIKVFFRVGLQDFRSNQLDRSSGHGCQWGG